MINLENEKSLALDAQERYDIISFAMDAADDNGFINSFVFERALYCFAAIALYPEQKDAVTMTMAKSPMLAWFELFDQKILDKMIEEYGPTIEQLAQEAQIWFNEYSDWAHSARGILDIVQQFTGNFVEDAAFRLQNTAEETGVNNIIDIANEWGMGRDALKNAPKEEEKINNEESLFE